MFLFIYLFLVFKKIQKKMRFFLSKADCDDDDDDSDSTPSHPHLGVILWAGRESTFVT